MFFRKPGKSDLWSVVDAVDLAGMGEPGAGYERLLAALRRAEAQCGGSEDGEQIVRRCRERLDRFVERYELE